MYRLKLSIYRTYRGHAFETTVFPFLLLNEYNFEHPRQTQYLKTELRWRGEH